MGVCVTLTDDCLQHLVRQLDVKALVRSGAVCKAWRQAATTPEPWELLYEASWGDSELVEGCRHAPQLAASTLGAAAMVMA
ncbi:hypothetical protein T484DRAFT_1855644 [Baffinella frigidus]|nr:hypothetical protein T484DRAFT_1855644 [Cryptophyta sp. CCMP2293]